MLNAGSSTGWTDEKHMLYITSLEESFVNQLYSGNGEINSVESFYQTPGVWQKTSYSRNGISTKYDQGQGYWGMVEVDEAESRLSEVGYIESSDQNFFDEEAEGSREQGRRSTKNQQKRAGRSTWRHRFTLAGHSWLRSPVIHLGSLGINGL
ncbi:hypothetical protein BAE44_0015446 [Dichanthelium oligosanthes]|uniref:Uncharacterized protein n=1 Tax=Dichanthelium oligosanthes TaxID=888268 RepID=A0A1E5VEM2_9POAL|nr:hypothetical protein BAE44_0015446 [Dichanthelium oligosanthes]